MRRFGPALLALALFAAGPAEARRDGDDVPLDWRKVATAADKERIRGWRSSWMTALGQAGRDHAADVRREGALLQPDAGSGDAALPPGDYRCRMIKLGAQGSGTSDYATYPPFRCRIGREADALSFAKLTGSQRPVGLLFPDGPDRMVFLGSMMLGDERRALDYGSDAERDMAGLVERIGPKRWRLVFPRPRWESLLDVIELVPE